MFDKMKDKAQEFADENPEKVEEYSDKGIQAGGGKIDEATGGKFGDQVQQGEQMADDRIGERSDGGDTPAQ